MWFQISFSLVAHLLLSQHIYKAVGYSHNFPVGFSSSVMHHHCSKASVFQSRELPKNTSVRKFLGKVSVILGTCIHHNDPNICFLDLLSKGAACQ